MPASSPECFSVLNDHLKRSVERVEEAGVAVIGIGIQTSCVSSFYKNYAVVNNLGDMAGEFFTILRHVLKETSTIRR
jgi:cobalamin biosynthesis protein CobT